MNVNLPKTTPDWTLFLDRDGVINHKLEADYVKTWDEFEFLPKVLEAMSVFAQHFGRIILVTNQQGIGKGLMTEADLTIIHQKMLLEIEKNGGRIDQICFAPQLASEHSILRKPNTGMPEKARANFPEINFQKSIVIGDSESDMQMGQAIGAFCIGIGNELAYADCYFPNLFSAATALIP